ncbi:MAG: phosphoribosylformylglycinamidine synthase subunit PurS [Bacteroidota bacterium]|nr:phosphoribosylformylglycinamidine synthase subunit PurS [Bacteroidota bacterium]MDP4230030.1 phosphoribosylformylglycinamidine synthase subunit PurS [Bacteroidota bacterium]MDP4234839.1 phosphoribosylformylglycinamidine synthase subunit PurS [Bacteroidota bacterium]
MHYHVYIATERKEAILDPQGKATHHALDSLGLPQVEDVRIGKFIRLGVNAESKEKAQAIAEESSKKLLANPIMETFRIIEIKENANKGAHS